MKRIAAFALLLALTVAGLTPLKAQSPGVAEWARTSRVESKKYAKQQDKLIKKTYKNHQKAAKKYGKTQRKTARKTNRGH